MSLIGDLIAQLRAAMAKIGEARATVAVARGQADEMIAEITTAADGSSDERPAEAVVRLRQAQVRLDEAIEQLQA